MSLDPNQPYVPASYPRMLFLTLEQTVTVYDEEEEAEARTLGYGDLSDIRAEVDGLDVRTHEELIDITLKMMRAVLAKSSKEDLIAGVRAMRAKEAEQTAAVAEADSFDAMDDEALRAFITERDGKPPHHRTGREKLLKAARGDAAASAEIEAEDQPEATAAE